MKEVDNNKFTMNGTSKLLHEMNGKVVVPCPPGKSGFIFKSFHQKHAKNLHHAVSPLIILYQIIVKWTISSQSEQTFNRAWN